MLPSGKSTVMTSMTSSPNLPKSGAISKGYNFAATWEQNAPLTDFQQAAIAALAHSAADRPYPSHLNQVSSSVHNESSLSNCLKESIEDSRPAQQVLVNTNQFYKWFSELESAMKSETEEKYQNYANTLTEHIKTCDHLLYQVDTTLNLFNELQLQHHAVATKTKTIRDDCDRLLEENRRSTEFAEALRNKLNYFDELEKLASVFNYPNMGVLSENFFSSLKRLDDSIMYVESNPQYAESGVYLVKFFQLQSRALAMIRAHVLSVLRRASSQVLDVVRSSKGYVSEGLEASVIYVRFEAAASELKPVLEEVEKRSSRKEYLHVLAECHRVYREQRLSMVKGIVHQRITEFAKKEALPSLTRSGCAYLMQVCQLEHQLFSHFFPSCEDLSILAQLMDPLCTYLYDTLRPRFIHETSLNFLCELVDILKVEVLGEQIGRRVETSTGLRPTLERILADVRERLTFVARTHIRNEIANYIPSDEDLDYPAKLEQSYNAEQETTSKDTVTSDAFKMYPPLEKTLSCLSMLYRHLEHMVFTGLAQEVMEVCSESIQKASKLITKRASLLDGQLFLIKHLLILREQIAPFDLDFSVTHKELDFSNLLEHLRRILRGQASIFDWSRSTSLARTLSPRVLENQIDARKEVEKSLKAGCEEFIMAVTKVVVDPMLSFVAKVTAVKVAYASAGQTNKSNAHWSKPLKDQAFATPDKVAELVHKVNCSIDQELPMIIAKMKLYLQNPSTQVILFKPIKMNIVEAHVQVESMLMTEYSSEDMQGLDMMPTQDLHARLDSLISSS